MSKISGAGYKIRTRDPLITKGQTLSPAASQEMPYCAALAAENLAFLTKHCITEFHLKSGEPEGFVAPKSQLVDLNAPNFDS
jgi:hypothetical protein